MERVTLYGTGSRLLLRGEPTDDLAAVGEIIIDEPYRSPRWCEPSSVGHVVDVGANVRNEADGARWLLRRVAVGLKARSSKLTDASRASRFVSFRRGRFDSRGDRFFLRGLLQRKVTC